MSRERIIREQETDNEYNLWKTFEVVMIGNTSVGKTSMLSALSNELDNYNLAGNVALEPAAHEFKVLQEQWNEMVEQVEAQMPFTTLSSGIDGAHVAFFPHEFNIQVEGSKKARVLFTDTSGAMTGKLEEELVKRIHSAFGVFCVVDASILMECPSATNERYNRPKFVEELLEEVYSKGGDDRPRFVAFVLTKCEKYMISAQWRRCLAKKFREVYDSIVDMLAKLKCPPNVYVLAVQTMGCVGFLKLDDTGVPVFHILPSKVIRTRDCAYLGVILFREMNEELDKFKFPIFVDPCPIPSSIKQYLYELYEHVEEPSLYEELLHMKDCINH